jgi:Holliday junction resolvase RusA-like endonuclease
MSQPYVFTLTGPIVPYVRRTSRGKYGPRARRYHASQNRLGQQFAEQMQAQGWFTLPDDTPLEVTIFARVRQRLAVKDVDNLAKAILDAAQGIVFVDDRHVYDLTVRTRPSDEDCAQVWVGVLDLEVS